jgi:NAD(P)H-dependent FMN reductase
MSKIGLISTSTRTPRVGPEVAKFVKSLLEPSAEDATLTIVDVADFKLPVYDEVGIMPAMVPAKGQFANAHSIAWSTEIAKYDAYIILANEYNFGMSGATKNAIDYLYNEWIGKPVYIVAYGIMGASNASEQLKTVLTGMKLRVVETRPLLGFAGAAAGPDLWSAAGGSLGEASQAAWTENKGELLKGFGELLTLLKTPA